MLPSHSIRAAAAVLALAVPPPGTMLTTLTTSTSAQPTLARETGTSNLTIFVRGVPVGTEQVTVSRTADGWTISSAGRLGPPIDAVARRIEVRYTGEWQAREFTLEGTARGVAQVVHTVIQGTQATSDIETGGQKTQKTDAIDPNAVIVLPNTFFGPFEAVAARLKTTPAGGDIPAFGAPAVSFVIKVGESTPQQIQTAARMIAARRTAVKLALPGALFDADIWTDEAGRLLRFSVPAQSLEVVREDVASVAARSVTISRPNDEAIRIPGNGFMLAGTLSRPAESVPSVGRRAAVVLLGGSGPTDRDELAFGIPVLGQIADAIAEAGFIVLRYDKRGIGQSGGRAESAGLADYAEDVRAAVKMLSDRKDVDPKRIAVVGHSEGGAVALIAASKDKRIAAVGLIATSGVTGADLILAQQQHALDRMKLSPEERQAKIDLQKRIHEAVLTGKGWEQVPPELRRSVDTPEFQSILSNDPAKVMAEVRQPVLIVQGALDTQVAPSNADRLESLARKRKNQPAVEVARIPGVNHLLVPATTGEVDEYGNLKDERVSPAVTEPIVAWLKKTL
ncbi:MAG TPA: alpha/beta fold hydrolase [Vicinamibacterales bacterium]|nr:alpha/beta fold hydrolase [Vicinamibacterales bacterium]